jgi:hypothetical protein
LESSLSLNLDAVGSQTGPLARSWESEDALLYALGVGAGALGPNESELEYTTENSLGLTQKVLPTFAAVKGMTTTAGVGWGEVDRSKIVHGEQMVDIHSTIPARGSIEMTTTIEGIYDKGSGALVVL